MTSLNLNVINTCILVVTLVSVLSSNHVLLSAHKRDSDPQRTSAESSPPPLISEAEVKKPAKEGDPELSERANADVEKDKQSAESDTEESEEGNTQQDNGDESIGVTQGDHYLMREQLWDKYEETWIPFKYTPPKPRSDFQNYFYVNIRRRKPHDELFLVLTDFSRPLIDALRAPIGGTFFHSDPECEITSLYTNLQKIRIRLETGRLMLEKHGLPLNVMKDGAAILGSRNISSDDFPDRITAQDMLNARSDRAEVHTYVKNVVEHLSALVQFLEKEFRPTAERLAACLAYGQMEYDLLVYYFEAEQEIWTQDCDEKDIAFELGSTEYTDGSIFGGKSFLLRGTAYIWDGTQYTSCTVRKEIEKFSGTVPIDSLPCRPLESSKKYYLTSRGRKYAALAGVHHKICHADRIIIDRRAYRNQSGYTADPDVRIPEFDEKRLHLLPPEVYGFNLTKKKWKSFYVEEIRDVVFDENAWDHLVLNADTKTLIRGLVDVTRNANSTKTIISDVISGKGGGLISVLHGPPGTGKTLTAEAVAEYLKRPLYMVGSSELSSKPGELEESLRGILSLAMAWDAVLLIDEADVFLEQRSLNELERNALVSVALRVLEYHRGVLFLTTNRTTTFDDAFPSRFSVGMLLHDPDSSIRIR